MTSAVTGLTSGSDGSSQSGTTPPGVADAAAFKSATAASTSSDLTVSGNTIDTGRYTITASTDYTRPAAMGGGTANDGMLSVFDKQTNTSVEVFGDPHVYTSAGDRANFQADGLTLNLADGTQVQFKPTAETNGVSHIDEVSVSKNNQTIIDSGFNTGTISTGAIQQGGPSSAQGFNDVRDTVLNAASDGSLGTLSNTMGVQLQSTGYEDALDGMGGGYGAFGSSAGTAAMQQYSAALSSNSATGSGPLAADEPKSGAASTVPVEAAATTPADTQTGLLQQLISLLQPTASTTPASSVPASSTPVSAGAASGAQVGTPGSETSLLQQLISLLQGKLGDPQTSSAESKLIGQLLPLLQQKLDSLSGSASASDPSSLTSLLQELVTGLGGSSAATQVPASASPAAQAVPTSYNPAMGISGSEIQAMLANANGTGPEINFADYDKAASNYAQSEGSSTAGGQVASLNAQMGGEAT